MLGLLHQSPVSGVPLAASPLPRLGASLQALHVHSPRSHANSGLSAGRRAAAAQPGPGVHQQRISLWDAAGPWPLQGLYRLTRLTHLSLRHSRP